MDGEPSLTSHALKKKINMYENTRLRLVFRHIALEVPDPGRVRQVRRGRRRAMKHVFTRDDGSCVRAITDRRPRRAAGDSSPDPTLPGPRTIVSTGPRRHGARRAPAVWATWATGLAWRLLPVPLLPSLFSHDPI